MRIFSVDHRLVLGFATLVVVLLLSTVIGSMVTAVLFRHYQLDAEATPQSYSITKRELIDWRNPHYYGKITIDGDLYKIAICKSGRVLASGPSWYLFKNDQLYDWTRDVNDSHTEKYQLDLKALHLDRIEKSEFLAN